MLTLQQLKEMPAGTVFATGETVNSPDGCYMIDDRLGDKLRWVAKRGGIHDWAIYIDWAEKSDRAVELFGFKLRNTKDIEKLVPCDQEALNMYRF